MSVESGCAWALLRSSAVAAAAAAAASGVRALLAASSGRVARLAWLLHLLTYLTPVVLVGYAYSYFALSLVHYPLCNELVYDLLVCLKLVPLATLVLWFAPSPISPEAAHCFRLLRSGGETESGVVPPHSKAPSRFAAGRGPDSRPPLHRGRLRPLWSAVARHRFSWRETGHLRELALPLSFWLRGAGRAVAGAFLVVFLLAFGEFEMASFFGVPTWTVTLFDAHAGGLALPASLRLSLPAVVCEGILLLLVAGLVISTRSATRAPARRRRLSRPAWFALWAYLLLALGAASGIPILIVARRVLTGLSYLPETSALARDIAASVLFGAVSAGCAYLAAGVVRRGVSACTWSLPGLLGPLVLSLVVLALFQLPGLRPLYDTPLPLLLALAALLFPVAWVLRALLGALRRGEAVHAAALLRSSAAPGVAHRARGVLWELEGRGRFWGIFLLFWWGYFDLTASSILAPSQVTPVLVRLYNFMHYGHSAALSVMVCVAFAVPFVLLATAVCLRRAAARLGV